MNSVSRNGTPSDSPLETRSGIRGRLEGEDSLTELLLPDVGDTPRVVFMAGQGFVLASTDLPPWRFVELHRHPETIWIPCPGCDTFICTVHNCHAFECECPPIEDWEFDPYAPVPPGARLPTQAKKEKTP